MSWKETCHREEQGSLSRLVSLDPAQICLCCPLAQWPYLT